MFLRRAKKESAASTKEETPPSFDPARPLALPPPSVDDCLTATLRYCVQLRRIPPLRMQTVWQKFLRSIRRRRIVLEIARKDGDNYIWNWNNNEKMLTFQ